MISKEKVDELQEALTIGKLKLDELEAFLGDKDQFGGSSRRTIAVTSQSRGARAFRYVCLLARLIDGAYKQLLTINTYIWVY